MASLEAMIERGEPTTISGPYSTVIDAIIAKETLEGNQFDTGVLKIPGLSEGASAAIQDLRKERRDAILGEPGKSTTYVEPVTQKYVTSINRSRPLALVTNTWRIDYEHLRIAGQRLGADLVSDGTELMLYATKIARRVMEQERDNENTILMASISPPCDSYKGENTQWNVADLYAPQVFAAVRFSPAADCLLFETIPSYMAALGAMRAFNTVHEEFNIADHLDESTSLNPVTVYWGDTLSKSIQYNKTSEEVPTYDKGRFTRINPKQSYILSFCLDKDGKVHPGRKSEAISLGKVIDDLYKKAESEGLTPPSGIGINCNSPAVTFAALKNLTHTQLDKIISIHPNASDNDDPRTYHLLHRGTAIEDQEFVPLLARMQREFNVQFVGGCCGSTPATMSILSGYLS